MLALPIENCKRVAAVAEVMAMVARAEVAEEVVPMVATAELATLELEAMAEVISAMIHIYLSISN